ncbi:S-adenosyl-l-methionine hydroxide adenosyltransferase family protein [Rubrivirga sp. IMCC43871]|uniref:SAM hydrolase/SAM-dependent halogenase family protein n=1 Tax=Rubrivirga sp. IMCC43871 TaxID=3391575 RepID=UPI00398FCAE3
MIVTLTTDFGTRDGYVAAMKGAMLCSAAGLTMVDVTHEVPGQDVMAAAFALRDVVGHFPAGTVHLVVVDPGVGTDRRAIAARFQARGTDQLFVGPDNGLLPLIASQDSITDIVELDARSAPSRTFHGRDVFGPTAARLATGTELSDLGAPVDELTPLHWPLPRLDEQGVYGMVLHVDAFGNCLTNITRADLDAVRAGRRFKCFAGSAVLRHHVGTYGEASAGDAVTLFSSGGLLEIAVSRGDAAQLLSVSRGDAVNLVFEGIALPEPATS